MFKITRNKGFHMTFENGVTVSVQFGYGNYCENYDNEECASYSFYSDYKKLDYKKAIDMKVSSKDAEVAIWDKNNKWILNEYNAEWDRVKGYLTTNEVLDVMNWAKNY